jgi:hypothetical protein
MLTLGHFKIHADAASIFSWLQIFEGTLQSFNQEMLSLECGISMLELALEDNL